MFESLGRPVAVRGATITCIGILAASLSGCSREPAIPLPDCHQTAQFGERSFGDTPVMAADGYDGPGDIPAETPEPDPGTTETASPEPEEPPVTETRKPDPGPPIEEQLNKASLEVRYKGDTKRGRVSAGFFVKHSGATYAFTAAHLFDNELFEYGDVDLSKAVILTQDGYTLQPVRGCRMAERDGRKVDPKNGEENDVDVAVFEVQVPDDAKDRITALPLAAEPLPANSQVYVYSFEDGSFHAKTLTSDGSKIQAGVQTEGRHHPSEYHIDPGDSGSLVASVSGDRIAVQGLVTSASNYHKHQGKLQTVNVSPAIALQKAIEGLHDR